MRAIEQIATVRETTVGVANAPVLQHIKRQSESLMHLYYSVCAKAECAVVETTKSENRAVEEFGLLA